jgi:L-ascorbate metabolism protein UlaG (beta-lactamase superfamily)
MIRILPAWLIGLALAACSPITPPSTSAPVTPAGAARKVELLWLGQAAFKITSPTGKVIVTDPWLRTNPLTPADYKMLETIGKIDVLLVSHGHFDHIADAPALAQMYNVPLRGPGDLLNTVMTLGVLPANLLPRMNKGGTVEPAPGIKVTAVRAEHSSIYVWRNPTTNKDETHPGGEAIGWIIELENGFRIYHAGDTAVFGDMRADRRALQARPGAGADRGSPHDGPGRRRMGGEGDAEAESRDPDALRKQPVGERHGAGVCAGDGRECGARDRRAAGASAEFLIAVPWATMRCGAWPFSTQSTSAPRPSQLSVAVPPWQCAMPGQERARAIRCRRTAVCRQAL